MKPVDPTSIWTDFCAKLQRAGAILTDLEAPTDAITAAEGLRYLTRLTRAALESIVESSDVDAPRLFQLSNETIKIGGDNPDNIYFNATIQGDRTYRISGTRGSVPYLSFGTKANGFSVDGGMISTGELEDAAMQFEADGSFEIIVSTEPYAGNWLPMTAASSLLLVRQTFLRRDVERPATVKLSRVSERPHFVSLDPAELSAKLTASARFVNVTARTFANWATMFKAYPNTFHIWDQSIFQKVGGDPNIHYLHAFWEIAPDEAWVIETDVPECRFWNFVLQNWWMESGDYRRAPDRRRKCRAWRESRPRRCWTNSIPSWSATCAWRVRAHHIWLPVVGVGSSTSAASPRALQARSPDRPATWRWRRLPRTLPTNSGPKA